MTARKETLSNPICKNAEPSDKDYLIWDTQITGFFLKVTKTGNKVFGLYYRTKTGKQRRPKIGTYPELKTAAAREIAQQWIHEVAIGGDPAGSIATTKNQKLPKVRDLAERHMKEHVAVKKKKGESQANDERLLRLHVLPEIGDLNVIDVGHDHIFRMHRKLQEKYVVNGNRALALCSKMFNNAELWKMRPDGSNPCRFVELDEEEDRERYLEDWEWSALANALNEYEKLQLGNIAICWLIRLIIFTGCRRGEIMNAELSAIDLQREVLVLSDHKTATMGRRRKKRRKEITLNSNAMEVISDRLRHSNSKDNPWLIPGKPGTDENGEIIHRHMINPKKAWEKIKDLAGIKDLRIHDLRHAFATVGIDDDIDMTLIQKLLGHSKIETTMRYAHRRHSVQRKTQDRIAKGIVARMNSKKA